MRPVRAPCPACATVVLVSDALDHGCPECGTSAWVLREAARGGDR